MNAVVISSPSGVAQAATAVEIKAQVQRVQQVMKAVMKDKVHFGIVPGTPKPSLWKPGAEVLCATFHIAPTFRIDDLSDHDSVRYRVTCVGVHQNSGITLGEGMGECSSNEEKYKWKATYNNREWDATDDSRKRIKFGWNKDKREEFETRQIRVEPADVANTILKMACKRAHVAMTLNVVAASDCFTQDLEDLPDGVRENVIESERGGKPTTQAPQAKAATSGGHQRQTGIITEKQLGLLRKKADLAGMDAETICTRFKIESLDKLAFDDMNKALAFIADPEREAIHGEGE